MAGRFTVGGMSFDDYDPHKDPAGEIGHRLAEEAIDSAGGFDSFFEDSRDVDYQKFVRLDGKYADSINEESLFAEGIMAHILREVGMPKINIGNRKGVPVEEASYQVLYHRIRKLRREAARSML